MTFEEGAGWRMYLGDCLEVMTDKLPFNVAAHVITDPPYEVEAHTKARRALCDATQKRGAKNTGKVRRIDQPLEISFPAITDQQRDAAAVLFSQMVTRWVIAFCQIEGIHKWRAAYDLAGIEWVRGGVWRKPNGAPQFTGDRPGQGYECLAIGHPKGRKRWNGGGKHGVWTCPLDHGAGGKRRNLHPTQKPIALMCELVTDFTDAGETILDPFAGSGTTGVACIRLDRRFIGIERDEKFFKLAVERLRAEEASTPLLRTS